MPVVASEIQWPKPLPPRRAGSDYAAFTTVGKSQDWCYHCFWDMMPIYTDTGPHQRAGEGKEARHNERYPAAVSRVFL